MEVQDVVQAFRSWDTRGSGVIKKSSLVVLFKTLAPDLREDDIDRLLTAATEDGLSLDHVNYEEFVRWLWGADLGGPATAVDEPIDEVGPAEEEARRQGLWEAFLASASSRAIQVYPVEKVQTYFDEVGAKLQSREYGDHIKGAFFDAVDADHDGKVSFSEATSLIGKCLQCVADLSQSGAQPTTEEIKAAFDAHDTLAEGRGLMGVDEFLNLVRYLHVRVAEAALPMSRVVQDE